MSVEDAAYLAGLLDGEGYFGFNKRYKHRHGPGGAKYFYYEARIVLTMSTKEFMEEIAAMIPWATGTVGRNERVLVGKQKPAYRSIWSGATAVEICRAIYPYARLKRRHIELFLGLEAAKKVAEPERSGQGHVYPLWIKEMEQKIHAEFALLNKRGQENAGSLEESTAACGS